MDIVFKQDLLSDDEKERKKMKKKLMAMILAAAMVVSMSACGGSKDASSNGDSSNAASGDSSSFTPITLKMGNQHNSDSVANKLDQEMCDRIKEATEGRVTVELYSDSALGDYTNVFDELMLGSVDVEHISPVESYDARVSATMLP